MFMSVGDRVSATYWGPMGGGSRVLDQRAAEDDDGHWRWCLLARLEWLETEEAVESLLEAPRRCGARDRLPMPADSPPVRPTTLPISVDVRSIDMTPGPAAERRSGLAVWCGKGPDVRLMADILDAREVRPPPPLGSRSLSIVVACMPGVLCLP